jgi:hypothetical protein
MCSVYKEECPSTSHISGPETNPTFGFKQVMIALELTHPVVTPKHYYSQFEAEDVWTQTTGPARARSLWLGTSRSKERDADLSGVERVDGGG